MSFFEARDTLHLTFEAFAAHPFYAAINRSLVQRALAPLTAYPLDAPLTIVDMACGTGAITRLIAEELARGGRQARIIAVNPSADALRLAQRHNEEMGIEASFFEGVADELPTLAREAVAAFFCNAIHLITEKRASFRLMAAILASSGVFTYHRVFYQGSTGSSSRGCHQGQYISLKPKGGTRRQESSDLAYCQKTKPQGAFDVQITRNDGG